MGIRSRHLLHVYENRDEVSAQTAVVYLVKDGGLAGAPPAVKHDGYVLGLPAESLPDEVEHVLTAEEHALVDYGLACHIQLGYLPEPVPAYSR